MQRGIKVVSWDSGVAPAGRQIHLNPSNNALIGETNVKLAADALQALNVERRGGRVKRHPNLHEPEHLD